MLIECVFTLCESETLSIKCHPFMYDFAVMFFQEKVFVRKYYGIPNV